MVSGRRVGVVGVTNASSARATWAMVAYWRPSFRSGDVGLAVSGGVEVTGGLAYSLSQPVFLGGRVEPPACSK